jgi:hypothetical protein
MKVGTEPDFEFAHATEQTQQRDGLPGAFVQNVELATLPKNLVTLEQVATKVPLPPGRIDELARSGYMPCWIIDGRTYYQVAAVQRYIARNLAVQQVGSDYPKVLPVCIRHHDRFDLPVQLSGLTDRLAVATGDVSGVYFLIRGAKVVYVGQSVNVGARLSAHRADADKLFDYGVFLPLPESDLLRVEKAFIRLLRPEYNRTAFLALNRDDQEVLATLGAT